jgi:TPR repeat protein
MTKDSLQQNSSELVDYQIDEMLLCSTLQSMNENLINGFLILKRNRTNSLMRKKAFEIFFQEANQGDEQACWMVVCLFFSQMGLKTDLKKIKFYAEKAIKYQEGLHV